MNKKQQQQIWESYVNNENARDEKMRLPAGKIGQLHRKEMSAGKAGKPWGDETPVLEGVRCECKDCVHWIVGDRCKAESISITRSKECATYQPARSDV